MTMRDENFLREGQVSPEYTQVIPPSSGIIVDSAERAPAISENFFCKELVFNIYGDKG